MSSQEVSREQQEPLNESPLASLEFTRKNFDNPALEWRRLFSEILGTFLLVLVGAGGGVVNTVSNNAISRTAPVTAPGLMLLAIILFMGAISGAHLNPAVSIAFAARGNFPATSLPNWSDLPSRSCSWRQYSVRWACSALLSRVLASATGRRCSWSLS